MTKERVLEIAYQYIVYSVRFNRIVIPTDGRELSQLAQAIDVDPDKLFLFIEYVNSGKGHNNNESLLEMAKTFLKIRIKEKGFKFLPFDLRADVVDMAKELGLSVEEAMEFFRIIIIEVINDVFVP